MDHKPEQPSSIIEAVKNKQYAIVEAALKKGKDVETKDGNGKSLLLIATEANDLEMARLLTTHGADVNRQDNRLDSPFLLAGASGQTEFVKLFLSKGARFDVFNRYNGTALIPACERGHVEVVRILTATKGFPIDHVNRLGWTALMEAVVLGNGGKKHIEIVELLIGAGCNINIPDKDGVTALQHARSRNFMGIVKLLEKASS
ncbi:ankyrin repeat domain-containing protein [Dyadobacter linearis]|nr:ankyrin repeat domain-containing protein [Dyadobacter sp. CECT 9623]